MKNRNSNIIQTRTLNNKYVKGASTTIKCSAMALLIAVAMICTILLIVFESLLEIDNVFVRLCGYFITLLPIALLLLNFFKSYHIKKIDLLVIVSIFYQLLIVLTDIVFGSCEDITATIAQISTSFSLQVILYIDEYLTINKRIIKIFLVFNIIISCLFIFMSFSDIAYKYGNSTLQWLTLNLGNSNYTAVMLLGNFCILILTLYYTRKTIYRVFVFALSIGIFILLYKTNSRTSLVIGCLFLLCWLFRVRIKNWYVALCTAAPILFCIIYICAGNIDVLRELTILGKPIFSGRIELWSTMFEEFYTGPMSLLFGNYNVMRLQNAHNSFLVQFFNYGIIGVILYYSSIYCCLKRLNKKVCGRISSIAMLTILAFLLTGMAEGMIVTTGRNFCIFYLIAVVILKFEHDNQRKEKTRCNLR